MNREEARKEPMTSLRQTPWRPLCEVIETQIKQLNPLSPGSFYMEIRMPSWRQYPYVQVSNFESGAITLELSSDRFLTEPLTEQAKRILLSMGWKNGNSENPNWHKSAKTSVAAGTISDHIVITLRSALAMPITSWVRIDFHPESQGVRDFEGIEIDPANPSIFRIQSH